MGLLPDNLDFSKPRCTLQQTTLAGTRSLVLDNGILRLSVLPEYGGRLCSLFYRPLNLELLATEFVHGPRHTMSVHGGWCAAFPSLLADGEQLTRAAWKEEILEESAEAVAIRLSCLIERVSHKLEDEVRNTPAMIHVERTVRLVAGEAAVLVEDALTNRNIWPVPTTWSAVISLRAHAGDHAVFPVEALEVQRGKGPISNELDFGLLVSTPYQAMARDLREGWIGFRPAAAPVDVRITFPRDLLPHAVVLAQREDNSSDGSFRLQPIATPGPMATDARGGALCLPPKKALHLPIRLEVGAGIMGGGDWSRPGLQLAEMIAEQPVPTGRLAIWRIGDTAIALKTPRHLALLLPDFDEEALLSPEDLPGADLLLCPALPAPGVLQRLTSRTAARLVGPPAIRQQIMAHGAGEERAVALSPGARFDVHGLGVLALPARLDDAEERVSFLVQADHLTCYHTGYTEFLGEFGPIGEQFRPQLVFLVIGKHLSLTDALHAARQLQPRLVVPLGGDEVEREFIRRCRAQHASFAARVLLPAEGGLFDGWKLNPFA